MIYKQKNRLQHNNKLTIHFILVSLHVFQLFHQLPSLLPWQCYVCFGICSGMTGHHTVTLSLVHTAWNIFSFGAFLWLIFRNLQLRSLLKGLNCEQQWSIYQTFYIRCCSRNLIIRGGWAVFLFCPKGEGSLKPCTSGRLWGFFNTLLFSRLCFFLR